MHIYPHYSEKTHNIFWATLGNTASGALLMGTAYWYASRPSMAEEAAAEQNEPAVAAATNAGSK